MDKRIRVLIVDDHRLVRQGVISLLRQDKQIKIVGEASDGVEAVSKVRQHVPDVILMDLHMPRKSGIDAIREIMSENPNNKILVLTGFANDEEVMAAIKAGAIGFLLKDSPASELCRAISAIYYGRSLLHPTVARKLIGEFRRPPEAPVQKLHLTAREKDVLFGVSLGHSNQEIADSLMIGERTVRTHVSNLLNKLDLDNRTQIATYALRHGLIHGLSENPVVASERFATPDR